MSGHSGIPDAGAREFVIVVHPDAAAVAVPDRQVGAPVGHRSGGGFGADLLAVPDQDPPAGWADVLTMVRTVALDGGWPLGPSRLIRDIQIHTVTARSARLAAGWRWSESLDVGAELDVQGMVGTLLNELAGRFPVPPLRMPWMRRGWWADAIAWLDQTLPELGTQRTGDPVPVGHRGISSVAQVPTAAGRIWLKTVPGYFAREPAILTVLQRRVPERIPRLLARREAQGAQQFLIQDVGTVSRVPGLGENSRLAALLAQLQVDTLDLVPDLAVVGGSNRTVPALAQELARITEEGMELDALDVEERAALKRRLPALIQQLYALQDGPLPIALLHGDCHLWNVARPKGSLKDAVLLDWTDAGVGPVGADLAALLPQSAAESDWAEVRSAYAAVWAAHLGQPLALVVAAVTATAIAGHAVQLSAYDEILRNVEPDARWECGGAMPHHLRALLA